MLESFRGLRKFLQDRAIGFGVFPAKTPRREVRNIGFLFLCVFAPLREIIPNLVAALPRWVRRALRGKFLP
jgi:hypothetical protein